MLIIYQNDFVAKCSKVFYATEKSNGVAVSTSSSINSALSGSNTNTSFSAIMNNSVTVPMTMGVKTVTSAEDDKESLKKDHSFTKSLSPVDFLSMGTVGNKLIVSGGSVTNGNRIQIN